jgi:hypothetical protein
MGLQEPEGPFCQSCGMPLERPEDFGTAADGVRVGDYCSYCYENGAFTDPDITMQGMIDTCVAMMEEQGVMPVGRARELMTDMIPKLGRWRAH